MIIGAMTPDDAKALELAVEAALDASDPTQTAQTATAMYAAKGADVVATALQQTVSAALTAPDSTTAHAAVKAATATLVANGPAVVDQQVWPPCSPFSRP
jgi:hypothetical protein